MTHKSPSCAVLFCLIVLAILAFPLSAQTELPRFVDVTLQAGITFVHSLGDDDMTNIVESNPGGCAFFDYNADNYPDIYFVNGAYTETLSHITGRKNRCKLMNALYRNNGDGTFTDVTIAAGVGDKGMGMGCSIADIDNDGDQDLFVTNWGPNAFYLNNGDGTFTEATKKAGLDNDLCGTGSTFLDYDRDGYLDLYLGNYVQYDPDYQFFYAANRFPGPLSYQGQPDVLYHNNGDGTFSDVTEKSGVLNPDGRAMGVTSCDIDNDGFPDIFVANDAMHNFLYKNNGDGTFTDVALRTATAFGQNGEATSAMSGEFCDINMDGLVDIVVPDMGFGCIYKNTAFNLFEEMSARMGLSAASGQYTSWSANFFDFNNDGFGDLFISNGHAQRLIGQEDLLLLSEQGKRFVNVSNELGPDFQEKFVSRGSAVGDYDNDGDMDVVVLNINARPRLLRNDGGNKGNWLMVQLIGTESNRDAVGSRILVTHGDKTQSRWRVSSSGFVSQSDPRIHFGLGQDIRTDRVEILWPNGKTQTLKNVNVNQLIVVRESTS
jgi:hypothetical protein